MRRTSILAVSLCALLLAGRATAADYNDAADGNWNDSATWNPVGVPAAGDNATLDSNTVTLAIDLTGVNAPDLITMTGGTLDTPWEQNRTIESPISVTGSSTFTPAKSWWTPYIRLSGAVSGSGKLVMDGTAEVRLNFLNSGFSGGWDVNNGYVTAEVDGGLGTGTINVNSGGTLMASADQTAANAPSPIIVNSGGAVRIANNRTVRGWDIELNDGGIMYGRGYCRDSTIQLSGTCHFWGEDSQNLYIYSELTGDGTMYLDPTGYRAGPVFLNNVNSNYSGTIIIPGGQYLALYSEKDGSLGTGSVIVDGGMLRLRNETHTAANQPAEVRVTNGGSIHNYVNVEGWNLKLDGGTLVLGNNRTWSSGTIQLSGDCVMQGSDGGGEITSTITGTGNLSWQYGYQPSNLILNADNSGWSGDFEIQAGTPGVCLWNGKGLGSGQTTVKGGLWIGYLGATGMDANVIIDGGSITNGQKDGWGPNSTAINVGSTITLVGEGALQCDGNMTFTIDGKLTGAGSALFTGGGHPLTSGVGTIVVTNTTNDYAGGTRVSFTLPQQAGARSELRVNAPGVLGTGAASIEAGRMVTDPVAGGGTVGTVVLAGLPAVNVAGGTLELASMETAGNIHLLAGGGLIRNAALVGTYTPTYGTDVMVYSNAIVPAELLPAAGDIIGAEKKVYQGTDGVAAGTEVAISGVVKGLGTLDSYPTISGTVSEAGGEGISLYAQPTRRIKLDGARFITTGELSLNGGGGDKPHDYGYGYGNWTGYWIAGADNFTAPGSPTVVNMNAAGRLIIDTADAVPAGVTLNINDGAVVQLKDAAGVGGSANVNAGGLLLCQGSFGGTDWSNGPSTGTWVINSGGAVLADSSGDLTAGAGFTWNPGAQLVVAGRDWPDGVPQQIDLLVAWEESNQGINITGDVVLNDNTRITHAADYYRFVMFNPASGDITTAGSFGRIAAQGGNMLHVPNKINMPGKTLIIGDANTFNAVRYDGFGRQDITQDGEVELRSTDNVMGKVWIQAGRLDVHQGSAAELMGRLGNATEVRIDAGAELYFNDTASDLTIDFTGNGTIKCKEPDARWVIAKGSRIGGSGGPHVGSFMPGSSVGVLTVDGGMGFGQTDFGGGDIEYGWLVIDVAGSGGVPGIDHDQAVVTSRGTFGTGWGGELENGQLKVALPLPSATLNPVTLATVDMVVVDAQGGIRTGALNDVALAPGVDSHWAITSGTAVTYDRVANEVLLHGSAFSWTGHEGDLSLDEVVNILDLGVLAAGYKTAGPHDWSTGDFNFDGAVNIVDLGLLAASYRWDGTGGGEPVPEPCSAILTIAGAGLLAVRRRKR